MNSTQSIKQSIKFQEGSVVSKEIVGKKAETVTVFAFDKGQGLSEHTAPYDALVIGVEGLAEMTVSGVKNKVGEGDMLLMPANSPHSLKTLEPFKMMLVMIKSL